MHKSNQPKVSIQIISFNQKDFIAEAIESAIGQDYENLEVIVSDDASTDGTAEIIAAYQQRYPDRLVALLNNNNVGITANSNRGLRECTGKYIAFQGGDDVLLPGKIVAQVEWFEKNEERVLCGHQVEVFYQDGSQSPHLFQQELPVGFGPVAIIRHGVPYAATSIMVKAEKIPTYGFEELLYTVSDHMLWIEVLMGDGEYGYVEGVYARYRRHPNNITNKKLKNLHEVERTLELVARRYPQYRSVCEQALVRWLKYSVAITYYTNGETEEARKIWFEIIRLDPFYFKPWLRIGQSFLRRKL